MVWLIRLSLHNIIVWLIRRPAEAKSGVPFPALDYNHPLLPNYSIPHPNHHVRNMGATRFMMLKEPCGVVYGNPFDDSVNIDDLEEAALIRITLYHDTFINSLTVRVSIASSITSALAKHFRFI